LYEHFNRDGEKAIQPTYNHCGQNHPNSTPEEILSKARSLRKQHPKWGAGLIRLMIQPTQPDQHIPVARTLQRHFQRTGLAPAAPGPHPKENTTRATQPHQVWQVDASEQMKLKNGRDACWMRVVDEFSGAVLDTKVFDSAHISQVRLSRLRSHMRTVFSRWGRPFCFRVDNGFPFGSQGDFPPELSLWILGLDIEIIWNPPRQPQKNGVVERSQGTGKNWAEPSECTSVRQLQSHLQKMDKIQREKYPSVQGASRIEAFPELSHSGRKYDAAWEKKHWSYQAVLEHVAGYVDSRKVSPSGHVSIYSRTYYVGKHHRGKSIFVYLDPTEVSWVFATEDDRELRTHPAKELTRSRILQLDVTYRRPCRRRPK
jgi:transposase InsO family protein